MTAEMGGKDAIIVDSFGRHRCSGRRNRGVGVRVFGQKCSACSRVIVLADVYDQVVDGVVARTRELVSVGSGVKGAASMGAVVDKQQFDSINTYIEIGKKEAKLVYQGDVPEANGYYVPPDDLRGRGGEFPHCL